jgi:Phosphotransferase enzyme family
MTRQVTLVLVDGDGALLGAATSFETAMPYWQEMGDIEAQVRRWAGVDVGVAVLRLLRTQRPRPHGGAVTYLAEVPMMPSVVLVPVDDDLRELVELVDERRAPYAQLGGPAASLAWSAEVLGAAPVATVMERTWNLSAIWRLDDGAHRWWLKQLPTFLRGEERVLAWLAAVVPEHAPEVVAVGDDGRLLMADATGVDFYGADPVTRARIVVAAHRIQRAAIDAADELVARGVPDRRGALVSRWIRSYLNGWTAGSAATELLDRLDDTLAAIEACGLPATLVHGDANPGNARGDDEHLTFLDWGEANVGHPGFDVLGLVADLTPPDASALIELWADLWCRDVPGSDPLRAVDLLRPVAALYNAALFANFVAHIEATEQVYHRDDVPEALQRAVELAATPSGRQNAPPAAG